MSDGDGASVLQFVAVCCSALQCIAVSESMSDEDGASVL